MEETGDRSPFAIFITHKRHQEKVSQRSLALAINVTQTKIHGWEKGARAPHSRHLFHLFAALNMTAHERELALILLAQS